MAKFLKMKKRTVFLPLLSSLPSCSSSTTFDPTHHTGSDRPLPNSNRKRSKLNLEPFWAECPDLWFAYAEAVFDHHRIKEDQTKNELVLDSLVRAFPGQEEYVKKLNEFTTFIIPYPMLKTRVKQTYELDPIKNEKRQVMDISPANLTQGSVGMFVSGWWNPQQNFRVQIVEMPPESASSKTKTDFLFVKIADGKDMAIVKIPSHESSQLGQYFGRTTNYPVIEVLEAHIEYLDDSSFLKEVPGK